MKYLIVIEMEATPKAGEQFEDAIDALIVEQTQAGGISTLESEVVKGKNAERGTIRVYDRKAPRRS